MPNRVALDQDFPNISASQALWERARGLIPAGTQTLAKGPTQYVDGIAPKYLARGKGCRVWDVDGNEFIDLSMAIGPVVLGYAHPAVDRAIAAQLESGITFSLMHPLEVGAKTRIALRPENISIGGPAGANVLRARVLDRVQPAPVGRADRDAARHGVALLGPA